MAGDALFLCMMHSLWARSEVPFGKPGLQSTHLSRRTRTSSTHARLATWPTLSVREELGQGRKQGLARYLRQSGDAPDQTPFVHGADLVDGGDASLASDFPAPFTIAQVRP